MKFETAMKQLEDISAKMEQNDISLDEALKLYEKGTGLIRECNRLLDEAENKMNEVNEL